MAAAVILRTHPLPVRIDDSKRLTRLQRERAFSVILESAHVGFGIIPADGVDRLNILQASLLAMQEAIRDLRIRPDLILIDGPVVPASEIPCRPLIGGDRRSYAIACASIMAKVLRDRLMVFYHQLAPDYAFDRHMGYGTSLHQARLQALGPSVFHRMTFRPVAKWKK